MFNRGIKHKSYNMKIQEKLIEKRTSSEIMILRNIYDRNNI